MRSPKWTEIKAARIERKYSLRSLGLVVGVSRQALLAYETGQYPPKEEVWKQLKKALHLPGTVEDYWGRDAHAGKPRMYYDSDVCSVDGCTSQPISKGLCRKHYQRDRYQRIAHELEPSMAAVGA